MNRRELLSLHEDLSFKARALMIRKNSDYAGETSPFANFEIVEVLGLGTREMGCLVRLADKLSRLSRFAKSGVLKVTEESITDTVLDTINYAILYAAMVKERQEEHT